MLHRFGSGTTERGGSFSSRTDPNGSFSARARAAAPTLSVERRSAGLQRAD